MPSSDFIPAKSDILKGMVSSALHQKKTVVLFLCLFLVVTLIFIDYDTNMEFPKIKSIKIMRNPFIRQTTQMSNLSTTGSALTSSSTTTTPSSSSTKKTTTSSSPKTTTTTTTSTTKRTGTKQNKYIVDLPNCKMPYFEAFSDVAQDILDPPQKLHCQRKTSISYQTEDSIVINWKEIKRLPEMVNLTECRIRGITRPVNKKTNHNSWKYLDFSKTFVNSTKVDEEHINLQCYDKNNKVIFENYHQFVFENDTVEKRYEEGFKKRLAAKNAPKESLNVLLVAFDSTSRLNSVRFMNKTRELLFSKLNAVEMFGHTKVGDNTFENMTPVLTGRFVHELPWSEKNETVFDDYDFVWKHFNHNGYRTLYTEDSLNSIYDYIKDGFHNNPTDYYDRHYHLAMKGKFHGRFDQCFLDTTQTEVLLNFTYRFMSKFKQKHYFGLTFTTYITHDSQEHASAADDFVYNFLNKSIDKNLLKNTVLFFMGDHGYRYGSFRRTFQGTMEDRLPMMYISFPKWFTNKYPFVMENLRINSRRLTSHFDIHETIMDILYFQGTRHGVKAFKPDRGYSLISTKVPVNRKCEDAGIGRHLCTCLSFHEKKVDDVRVINSSLTLVHFLNERLEKVKSLCYALELDKIISSYELVPQNSTNTQSYYKVTIQVKPGGGQFEGTVAVDRKTSSYKINKNISRVNMYGNQARCAVDSYLERLCYCRNQTSSSNKT